MKLSIVEKEASETQYWLEIFEESDLGDRGQCRLLLKEAGELLAIFTAARTTSRTK